MPVNGGGERGGPPEWRVDAHSVSTTELIEQHRVGGSTSDFDD